MNGSHVAATSGVAGNLAAIIIWISNSIAHGDWFPVDSATAIAISTLIVSAVGASGVSWWNSSTKNTASEKVTTEVTKP